MARKIAVEIICFLLIVLFLYTGLSKLFEYRSFTDQLTLSPLLTGFASSVAWFVPSVEIAAAILLIIPRFRLKGLWLSMLLMAAFTLYVIVILSFSEKLPCSCGGILQTMNWREHLVFNVLFLVVAVIGVLLGHITKMESDNVANAISTRPF